MTAEMWTVHYQTDAGFMHIPASDVGVALSILANAVRHGAFVAWIDSSDRGTVAAFRVGGFPDDGLATIMAAEIAAGKRFQDRLGENRAILKGKD